MGGIKKPYNVFDLCPHMYYASHSYVDLVYTSSGTYMFLNARPLSLALLDSQQDPGDDFGPQ